MLRLKISIFVCFLLLVDGLEIIQPPPDSIWVRESGSVELSCQSDQSWQWCYWEMITREGSTNQNTRYQAYQVKLILHFTESLIFKNTSIQVSNSTASFINRDLKLKIP